MIGVVPSSINVPLLLASIIRSQYNGSDVSEETMPYSGIWLMTKNMSRVNYGSVSVAGSYCDRTSSYPRPHELLVEGNLCLRGCHLRKEGRERFNEVEEAYCGRVSGKGRK